MQKIFLTGGMSLLGKAIATQIPLGWRIILAEHKNKNVFPLQKNVTTVSLDITDPNQVSTLISQHKPQIIIHAAALSNVDYCQTHPKQTLLVNVSGTQNVVNVCEKLRIPLFFISTNAVFGGTSPPTDGYSEEDEPNPVNFYGKSKYDGEKIVNSSTLPWIIIRLITMYGWPPPGARQNPATWVLEKLANGEKLKVVNDIQLNPLYNHDAAQIIWAIIQNGRAKNIYHVAGSEIVNRYQWAVETAKVFSFDPSLISPVPSSFFDLKIAPRPQQTIYSIEKIKREFGITPQGIKSGLKAMKNEKH